VGHSEDPCAIPVSLDNVELVEIADGLESLSLMSRLRMCAERLYGAVVWRLCTARVHVPVKVGKTGKQFR
jgi:hypothetical protein